MKVNEPEGERDWIKKRERSYWEREERESNWEWKRKDLKDAEQKRDMNALFLTPLTMLINHQQCSLKT